MGIKKEFYDLYKWGMETKCWRDSDGMYVAEIGPAGPFKFVADYTGRGRTEEIAMANCRKEYDKNVLAAIAEVADIIDAEAQEGEEYVRKMAEKERNNES